MWLERYDQSGLMNAHPPFMGKSLKFTGERPPRRRLEHSNMVAIRAKTGVCGR